MEENKGDTNDHVVTHDSLIEKGYQPTITRPVLPTPRGESGIIPALSSHLTEGLQPTVQRPILPPPQGESGIVPAPSATPQAVVDSTPVSSTSSQGEGGIAPTSPIQNE